MGEITDEEEWESVLLCLAPRSLFQSWAWGEVQRALGHDVRRIGWKRNGKLLALAQCMVVRAKRGRFLHIRHGPVLGERPDPRFVAAILSDLRAYAASQKCWFIRISPLIPDEPAVRDMFRGLGLVPAPVHAMDGEYCWVLDLRNSEQELLGAMRKSTRYDIRQAEKRGVRIHKGTDGKDMAEFLRLYKATYERHGFVPHTGIEEEYREFSKKGECMLFLGEYKGAIAAGALILFYGRQGIYHHGASINIGTPVAALVQWEAIREAKKRGMEVYNFWGIAPEDSMKHPWRGITLFKKGFGGHAVKYMHAMDLPISPWYVIPKTIETIRKIRKGYV